MSLFELVVALAAMTAILAIAAPRFAASGQRYRAELAARRVAADLALARSQARQSSSARKILFDPQNKAYQLVDPAAGDPGSTAQLVRLAEPPFEVDSLQVGLGGQMSVTFDGFGQADCGGWIGVQAGRFQAVVQLDAASGQASVK